MRLMYFIRGMYNSGGKERIITEKLNYLVNNFGYEIILITTDQKGKEPFFNLDSRIKCIDLKINYEDSIKKSFFLKLREYFQKNKVHYLKTLEVIEKYKPDFLVSTYDAEIQFLHKIKMKTIVELHFSKNFRVYQQKYYNKNYIFLIVALIRQVLEKHKLKKYFRVVALTKEDHKAWNLRNMISIPNVIYNPSEITADVNKKRVIAVGRLDEQKGFDMLIEAWNMIGIVKKDWKLNIYGDGPLKDNLIKKIRKYKLQNEIYIKGEVKDIEKEYLESSIFALSSRFEGMPMVLLEALNLGLPIVSYDCPCGPKELIQNNKNGFLIECFNNKKFAKNLEQLMNNQKMRIEFSKSSKLESYKYYIDDIMIKWKNLFEEESK